MRGWQVSPSMQQEVLICAGAGRVTRQLQDPRGQILLVCGDDLGGSALPRHPPGHYRHVTASCHRKPTAGSEQQARQSLQCLFTLPDGWDGWITSTAMCDRNVMLEYQSRRKAVWERRAG